LSRPAAGPPRADGRGPFELRELRNRNPRFSPANRPNLFYPIWVDLRAADPEGLCPVTLEPLPGGEAVEPRNREGGASVWRWSRAKLRAAIVPGSAEASEVVARRRRDGGINVYEKHRATTTKARSVWDEPELRSEQGTRTLKERLGVAAFDHPKPVALVQRCLRLATDPDGIVLDFFAGSGTTAEAVMELDAEDGGRRRFVLVQLPEPLPPDAPGRLLGAETIADVTRLRIAAVRPPTRGLRCFRLEPRDASPEPPDDPWGVALAAGFPLDARPVTLGPRTWSFEHGAWRLPVCLEPALRAADAQAWALPPDAAVACRADALDDELAFNLARRHPLSLL